MIEALLAMGIPLFFLGLVLLPKILPFMTLVGTGLFLLGLGAILGVGGGLVYHVRLRRGLLAAGALPARWWWHPTDHHRFVSARAWPQVRRPFWLGGVGFLLMMVGALSLFLATLAV